MCCYMRLLIAFQDNQQISLADSTLPNGTRLLSWKSQSSLQSGLASTLLWNFTFTSSSDTMSRGTISTHIALKCQATRMTPGGEKFTSISNSVGSISDTAQLVLNKKKAPRMANTLTTLAREGHLLCPDNLTTQGQTNMSKLVTTVIPHLLNHQDIISHSTST